MLPVDVTYNRQVLLGIRSYCRAHRPWELRVIRDGAKLKQTLKREGSQSTGLIGVFGSEEMREIALKSALPAVNVSGQLPEYRLPTVMPDDRATAHLAVKHFMERGFRSFAFAGTYAYAYACRRRDAFVDGVKAVGLPCKSCDADRGVSSWLGKLPRQTAVFASNDVVARKIVDACGRRGLQVPADIAVLGVDNDTIECELSPVPLSSIDSDSQRVGWEAARLLARLMRGRRTPKRPALINPRNVVARDSSNVLAFEDPEVAYAVSYIEAHACDPMNVSDIMNALTISRRTLEKRFRKLMGHSLHDEVRRVKFERAKALLIESDLLVPGVADRCGFSDPKRFTTLFREKFGIPPAAYRRKIRTA